MLDIPKVLGYFLGINTHGECGDRTIFHRAGRQNSRIQRKLKISKKIIRTVIAFANTAGGKIILGAKHKTKEVVGIVDILKEEEKIASSIADSIEPLIAPNIQICSWRGRDLMVIHVPYSVGPYFLKSKTQNSGTYIRFGSTNRLADLSTIDNIKRSKQRLFFDELPCHEAKEGDVDFCLAQNLFEAETKKLSPQISKSVGIFVDHLGHLMPSNGGIILFGHTKRTELFPNSVIRCAKFRGTSKVHFIDHQNIDLPPIQAIQPILNFIKKHTSTAYVIQATQRAEVADYPPEVIREAVINALVHTDYSIRGSTIQLAIFDDRIEITNPGSLPFDLSLPTAISGFSQLRNKVIGRVFRELGFIESLGTGLKRMLEYCHDHQIRPPTFEEFDHYFKVTIFRQTSQPRPNIGYEQSILHYINRHGKISRPEAQKIWKVSGKTTSTRSRKMCEKRVIAELSTGPYDPRKVFVLPESNLGEPSK